jgi:hypothetical protein
MSGPSPPTILRSIGWIRSEAVGNDLGALTSAIPLASTTLSGTHVHVRSLRHTRVAEAVAK